MYSEVELFEDCERIASRFSKLKANEFNEIWETICRYIETQLKHGKACSLVGLGKFTFQSSKIDTGTSGIKEQRVPVFIINESFLRNYTLRMNKPFYNTEIPVVEVNYFLIAQRSSTVKEVVTSVLKIVYNRLGEIMNTGKQVSLNFRNIGKLTSDRKIVDFTMEKQFQEPVELRYFEQVKNGPSRSSQKVLKPPDEQPPLNKEEAHRALSSEDLKLLQTDTNYSLTPPKSKKSVRKPVENGSSTPEHETDRIPSRSSSAPSSPAEDMSSPSSNKENLSSIIRRRSKLKTAKSSIRVSGSNIDLVPKEHDDAKMSPNSQGHSPRSIRSSSSNSLALTAQISSAAYRAPSQMNLDAVMLEAFTRHEKEVQKKMKLHEQEFRREQNLLYMNAQIDKELRESKRKQELENQNFLMQQMEETRKRRDRETNELKSFSPVHTSLTATIDTDTLPPLDIHNRERTEEQRIKQKLMKDYLDKQLHEKIRLSQVLRDEEIQHELSEIDKAKKDFEMEKQSKRKKKLESQKELRTAWNDQLYMGRAKYTEQSVYPQPRSPSMSSSPSSSLQERSSSSSRATPDRNFVK